MQDINDSISWFTEKFDDYEKEKKEKDQIIENLLNSKIYIKKRIEE